MFNKYIKKKIEVKELSDRAKAVIAKYNSRTTKEAYIAMGILKPVVSTDANGNHTYDESHELKLNKHGLVDAQ